ncbi:RNA-binding NOB1-like protein [Euphorbia peplus]|nr:RNA-binding NOB1-like protein [Euphorbia peplus]
MESAAASSCWSNIVKNQPPAPVNPNPNPTKVFVESCQSSGGISLAVIDANAVIQGGEKLHNLADKFVTVPEVLAEIRDPVSRHRLAFIPFTIDSMEPSPEALNKVIKFARATGDLQTLSNVDLKLIALTYTFEAQIHGTKHIRDVPPPIHTVNVRRLPEKELPGWGSNVPNLEEWEALEQESGDGSNVNSKILPLKEMSLNCIPGDNQSENGSVLAGSEAHSENTEDLEHVLRKNRRYPPKKKEINIEGKMVADGIDASQGQVDDDSGDWMPAVSRSTHRRFLRRKARREHYDALFEKDCHQDQEKDMDDGNIEENIVPGSPVHKSAEKVEAGNIISEENEMNNDNGDLALILEHMRLEEGSKKDPQEELEVSDTMAMVDSVDGNANFDPEAGIVHTYDGEEDHLDNLSETNASVDASHATDDASEQSWMLRSLSESSVACVTSDFAMQNVLLQMGLRLLAPGGMQIRHLQRWILKCHACYTVTAEIGRIFCPKCGNGGTLRKVAITVGENGITLADHRPRIRLRGTKFSLPLPQGGRDAIAKNIILREDQLPTKYLYPKTKKKVNKEGDDLFVPDDIFSQNTEKRAPFRPPVRKALAVFSGKRNPNDNHYARHRG